MQKITPHLWFDKEAREAAQLYTSAFPNSKITSTNVLHDTPSGTVDIVEIDLDGHAFTLLSAGPLFKFTPAISFAVACRKSEEVDTLWNALSEGGSVLMEMAEYPFAERYGWLMDRYGLSWQIMLDRAGEAKQKITPSLLFVGDQAGRAEEAIELYTSVFRNSRIGSVARYGAGEEPDREGSVKHGIFTLEGSEFAAMDSAHRHDFGFNEAVSLQVHCNDQQEIDHYWNALTADPKAEQCGWLKDKFGVSWQIVPTRMDEMLTNGTPEQIARVTEAFLQMKKFDLAKLEEAWEGR